ncbi:MAG: hypothetical protein RIT45_578 [Pseudomonadota bacterium]|jgi:hypothetical protein
MPSLRDQSFNREAWLKLGFVAAGGGLLAGLVYLSVQAHHHYVEVPHLLENRHSEPVGHPGRVTTSIAQLGGEAVGTLIDDIGSESEGAKRRKSLEILSGIEDPRVLPALAAALSDPDLGVRMAAIAGIARHGDPKGADALWKALDSAGDWLSQRIIVAIGLVGADADVDKCVERANATRGHERHLFAWCAGQGQRRQKERDQIGRTPPAPAPVDADDEVRIQAEIDLLINELDAGPVNRDSALRFAQRTAIEFGTWDYGHQISYQTIAIAGPLVVRGAARMDAVPVPVRKKKPAPTPTAP